jgi:hypothetical protein
MSYPPGDPMKIFIAGIMQGSIKGHGIQEQDYRQRIREAIKVHQPEAKIVDPFSLFPDSVTYDDQRAKQVLFAMAAEAGSSDIVIAYLPKASLGTALEMIRAYDNGKTIISISPMAENWFIRAFSTMIFPSLDEFCSQARQTPLTELIEAPQYD